jgi:hypothetical protein
MIKEEALLMLPGWQGSSKLLLLPLVAAPVIACQQA